MAIRRYGVGYVRPFKTMDELKGLLHGATYNQIGSLLTSGKVTEKELLKYYRNARETALKRVKANEKAGLPFGNKPEFRKAGNVVTVSDLVREIADVNRFLNAKTSAAARRDTIQKRLDTMHSRGLFKDVNIHNYHVFERFMNWFKSTGLNTSYSSESDEVEYTFETVLNTGADSSGLFSSLFHAIAGTGV